MLYHEHTWMQMQQFRTDDALRACRRRQAVKEALAGQPRGRQWIDQACLSLGRLLVAWGTRLARYGETRSSPSGFPDGASATG